MISKFFLFLFLRSKHNFYLFDYKPRIKNKNPIKYHSIKTDNISIKLPISDYLVKK